MPAITMVLGKNGIQFLVSLALFPTLLLDGVYCAPAVNIDKVVVLKTMEEQFISNATIAAVLGEREYKKFTKIAQYPV